MKLFISKTFKRDMGKVSPEILIGVEMTEVFYCLHRQLPLLIYRFANEELQLLRLNSHSQIFS